MIPPLFWNYFFFFLWATLAAVGELLVAAWMHLVVLGLITAVIYFTVRLRT